MAEAQEALPGPAGFHLAHLNTVSSPCAQQAEAAACTCVCVCVHAHVCVLCALILHNLALRQPAASPLLKSTLQSIYILYSMYVMKHLFLFVLNIFGMICL